MGQGTTKLETISKHRRSVAVATVLLIAGGVGAFAYSQMPPSYARTPATFAAGQAGQECRGFISDGGPVYPRSDIERRLPPGFAFGITRAELLPRLRSAGFISRGEPYDGLEHFTISSRYVWLRDLSQSTGLKPLELLVTYAKSNDPSLARPYNLTITFDKAAASPVPSIVSYLGRPTSGSYSRSCDPKIDEVSYLTAPEGLPQFGLAASDCAVRDPDRYPCVSSKAVGTCAFKPQHPDQIVMNVRNGIFENDARPQFLDLRESAPLISGKLPFYKAGADKPFQYCRYLRDPIISHGGKN